MCFVRRSLGVGASHPIKMRNWGSFFLTLLNPIISICYDSPFLVSPESYFGPRNQELCLHCCANLVLAGPS